jgi:predicted dinucleotide-binding enzyme
MSIGVIGVGGLGGTLARQLAELAHELSIANSRGPESLIALAAEIGATPVPALEATKAVDIVIVSIPTKAEADRSRIAEYRAAEETRIKRSVAAQTAKPSGQPGVSRRAGPLSSLG